MIPLGRKARSRSAERSGRWISQYTFSSRTRRAISWVYWLPKSRIRIRSAWMSMPLISATSPPKATIRMRAPFLIAPVTAALLLGLACVKDISSEERLEREISSGPAGAPVSAAELAKINCADATEGLAKARATERDETARLMAYMDLYSSLHKRVTTLEEGMSRDPDIRYKDESKAVVEAHSTC